MPLPAPTAAASRWTKPRAADWPYALACRWTQPIRLTHPACDQPSNSGGVGGIDKPNMRQYTHILKISATGSAIMAPAKIKRNESTDAAASPIVNSSRTKYGKKLYPNTPKPIKYEKNSERTRFVRSIIYQW